MSPDPFDSSRFMLILQRLSTGTLVLVILSLVYFLSAGPVFAFCLYREDDLYGICRFFDPIWCIAPDAMSHYLSWWGVSDIEAFFLRASREGGGFGAVLDSLRNMPLKQALNDTPIQLDSL